MKSRFLMMLLSLIMILTLLLAACAKPAAEATKPAAEEPTEAPPQPTKPPAPADKTKISFYFTPDEGRTSSCFMDTVVTAFNEQSETVIVDGVAQANVWETIRTSIAGGAGPDVVNTPGPSFVYELVKAGQLMELDELSKQYGWGDAFVDWALSLGEVDGKLYSLPLELETLVLYYNKTVFEKNGWQPPKTIEELWVLAKKMKDAGVIPFAHTNAEWRPSNEWFVGEFLNHVAGPQKVYDALTGKISWTDPAFAKAVDLVNEAQKNGWFMGGLELYYTTPYDDAKNALGKGEAAMNIEGTWASNDTNTVYFTAENGGNEWDWVPMPSVSGDAIFDIGIGSTWSINKATKNPQAVAEFFTFFFSSDVQTKLLVNCGYAPAPIHLKADAMQGVDPRIARIYEEFAKASDSGNYGYTTWTFWPPKTEVYITEEIEKVWAGEMTTQQYLEGMDAMFQQEFSAGELPPIMKR